MGFGKSTPIPGGGGRSRAGDRPASTIQQQPAILELQRMLRDRQKLALDGMTGVYDQNTHSAVEGWRNELIGREDAESQQIARILESLLATKVSWLRQNPQAVAEIVYQLQRIIPRETAPAKTIKDTPYYNITLPNGQQRMLPLALVYSRGYMMYQAILEQNGLIDMSLPVAQRLQQLTAATQAISSSLDPNNPNNANILYVITEADKDLRESWRLRDQGATAPGGAAPGTLASALGALVPEFQKASAAQKSHIINVIFTRFPSADKFMETPPNINSRVIDMHELRRNQASLTGVVTEELRKMGLVR